MRWLSAIVALSCFTALVFAAAPPARTPPEWLTLIDQLGDDDDDVRKKAEKKLDELGEGVQPALEKAAKKHADPDVRLRAALLVTVIDKRVCGEEMEFTGHKYGVTSLALSPDGKHLLSAGGDVTRGENETIARVWDVRTGKVTLILEGHSSAITAVAWSPDGKRLLTGDALGQVMLWDAATGKNLATMKGHSTFIFRRIVFTPDSKQAVTCSGDASVRLWDLDKGQEVRQWTTGYATAGLAMLPDGKYVVAADVLGKIRLTELATAKVVLEMDNSHDGDATSAAVSPNGRIAATGGGKDKMVRLHDLRTGKALRSLKGHDREVIDVRFSPDGKRLISASWDKTAIVWDVETGKQIQRHEGHKEPLYAAAFLPTGRMAVTAGYDGKLRTWRVSK